MTPAAAVSALVDILKDDGAILVLMLLIFWGGARKVWMWGRELERADEAAKVAHEDCMKAINDMREERDSWRRIALLKSSNASPDNEPHNDDDD
jgi:hypothetical protein